MRTEEAIEILGTAPILHLDDIYPRERTALHLGIGALKRLQDNRRDPEFDHWLPLPGETQDG